MVVVFVDLEGFVSLVMFFKNGVVVYSGGNFLLVFCSKEIVDRYVCYDCIDDENGCYNFLFKVNI